MSAPPTTWGPWRLDRERLVLAQHDEHGQLVHEIDLARCQTAADVLDAIMLARGESREAIGYLADALRDLLDPQRWLAPSGLAESYGDAGQDVAALVRESEIHVRARRLLEARQQAVAAEHGHVISSAEQMTGMLARAEQEVRAELAEERHAIDPPRVAGDGS